MGKIDDFFVENDVTEYEEDDEEKEDNQPEEASPLLNEEEDKEKEEETEKSSTNNKPSKIKIGNSFIVQSIHLPFGSLNFLTVF